MKKAFVLSFVVAIALSATMIMAQGMSDEQVSLQGRLADSEGKPLDGTYVVKFEIFDDMTAGSSLWSEVQSVTVDNGLFQTRLGKTEALALDFDQPYYVEVTVNDEKLSPRYMLSASPYVLGPAKVSADSVGTAELEYAYSAYSDSIEAGDNEVIIKPANMKSGEHGVMLCQTRSTDAEYDCRCGTHGFAGGKPLFRCQLFDSSGSVVTPTSNVYINYIAVQFEE